MLPVTKLVVICYSSDRKLRRCPEEFSVKEELWNAATVIITGAVQQYILYSLNKFLWNTWYLFSTGVSRTSFYPWGGGWCGCSLASMWRVLTGWCCREEGLVRSPLLCVYWPSPNAPWCLKCGGKGSVHAESKHREWLWSIFVPLSAESDLCLSSCEDQEGWSYALVGKWGPGEGC